MSGQSSGTLPPRMCPFWSLPTRMSTTSQCFTSILDEEHSSPQSILVPLGTSAEGFSSLIAWPPRSSSSSAMSIPSDLTPRNLAGLRLAMTSSLLLSIWSLE